MPAPASEDGARTTERLDLRGLKCPLPVLKSARRLADLAPGARLEILSDDPLAGIDLPLFCRQHHQTLVETSEFEGARRFLVERGLDAPSQVGAGLGVETL